MLFSGFDALLRLRARDRPLQCFHTIPCNMLVRCLLFPTLQLSRYSHARIRALAIRAAAPIFGAPRETIIVEEVCQQCSVNFACAWGSVADIHSARFRGD